MQYWPSVDLASFPDGCHLRSSSLPEIDAFASFSELPTGENASLIGSLSSSLQEMGLFQVAALFLATSPPRMVFVVTASVFRRLCLAAMESLFHHGLNVNRVTQRFFLECLWYKADAAVDVLF